MKPIAFEIQGIPVPKGSLVCYGKGGRHTLTIANRKRLDPWVHDIRHTAPLPDQPLQGPLSVEIGFRLPPPKKQPKGRHPTWHHQKTNDLDKLARAVLDALSPKQARGKKPGYQGMWEDDGQVAVLLVSKKWATLPEPPGATIIVTTMTPERNTP